MTLIYLDGGHGGKDSGAVGNGLQEKNIVLDICRRIENELKSYDCRVMQSRTADTYLTLAERAAKANKAKATVFVSVHVNAARTTSARGFETFRYSTAPAKTTAFQNVLHAEIMKSIGSAITDRGNKSANFHVLRETAMPAVLTENLFISNVADAELLDAASFRQKIAEGHANGIVKFLGLKKIERPPQPPPTNNKLYRVQVGAFAEKENADAMAQDLKRQGYRPYVKYE